MSNFICFWSQTSSLGAAKRFTSNSERLLGEGVPFKIAKLSLLRDYLSWTNGTRQDAPTRPIFFGRSFRIYSFQSALRVPATPLRAFSTSRASDSYLAL